MNFESWKSQTLEETAKGLDSWQNYSPKRPRSLRKWPRFHGFQSGRTQTSAFAAGGLEPITRSTPSGASLLAVAEK